MKILDFLKANSANNMEGARKRQRKKPKAKIHKRKGGEKTVVDPMLDRIGRTYVDWLRRQVVTKRDTAEKMHGQKKKHHKANSLSLGSLPFSVGLEWLFVARR
jgi:hypothetical protein